MYPFILVLVLSLAPWRPEYRQALLHLEIIHEEYPCDVGAWVGPDQIIHLCPAPGDRMDWLALHETQHIMASRYLPYTNWDIFSRVAMKALKTGGYSQEQIDLAEYILSYSGHELHAELPWIVQGDLPPQLQRWYPWFELEGGGGVAYARGASQANKRATILLALDDPWGRNLDARVVIPARPPSRG